MPDGITLDELPEHIISNYAPMATCILLLALACPNFDYAAIDTVHRERFMKVMQEKIDGPGFSQDAPRLRRLLFNGWDDC
ncbi:hypothetical protein GGI03_005985 [Coemansia sp. RSA 2337]|nr:hypothetical protein GGI03_005985 [Coemansia sp. RSA 2337]